MTSTVAPPQPQVVTITAAPAYQAPPPRHTTSLNYTISSGYAAHTSDEFAAAIFKTVNAHYLSTATISGAYSVFSPVTGLTYTVTCRSSGSSNLCTGGDDAGIRSYF
ncbi:MAG: hypothetical protein SPI77_03800 [Corynebacterium sp.]|nr:hypothetical protein [Corynebacterium sp.]